MTSALRTGPEDFNSVESVRTRVGLKVELSSQLVQGNVSISTCGMNYSLTQIMELTPQAS